MSGNHDVSAVALRAHHSILDATASQSLSRRQSGHLGEVASQDEPENVDVVHGEIERDPAARLRPAHSPGPQPLGQLDRVLHARGQERADGARCDLTSHLAQSLRTAEMMVGSENHTMFVAGTDHRDCIGHRRRQRLLTRHMPARLCRSEHVGAVTVVARADVHRVDSVVEHALEIRGRQIEPVQLGEGAGSADITAVDPADLLARGSQGRQHPHRSDIAGADQRPANDACGRRPDRLRGARLQQVSRSLRLASRECTN